MTLCVHDEKIVQLSNGTRLCYSSHGDEAAPAVLLIAGLGLQLVYWPAALVNRLVVDGMRVVCFDNRDAGRSSRSDTPHPGKLDQLMGRAPTGSYGVEEMADDTALLIQHLRLGAVHAVGMSMGGMIAQTLTYRHPALVKTLTSIFSTSGHRRVGQPAPSTLWRMATAKRLVSEEDAVAAYASTMRHIGDPSAPDIESHWRAYAALAWQRNGSKADGRAFFRQIGAILKSGDRTSHLQAIRAPSLVLHGDVDRMVAPSGGLAVAAAIPHARHEVLTGMRHQIDPLQSDRLAPLLLKHFRTNSNGQTR